MALYAEISACAPATWLKSGVEIPTNTPTAQQEKKGRADLMASWCVSTQTRHFTTCDSCDKQGRPSWQVFRQMSDAGPYLQQQSPTAPAVLAPATPRCILAGGAAEGPLDSPLHQHQASKPKSQHTLATAVQPCCQAHATSLAATGQNRQASPQNRRPAKLHRAPRSNACLARRC